LVQKPHLFAVVILTPMGLFRTALTEILSLWFANNRRKPSMRRTHCLTGNA